MSLKEAKQVQISLHSEGNAMEVVHGEDQPEMYGHLQRLKDIKNPEDQVKDKLELFAEDRYGQKKEVFAWNEKNNKIPYKFYDTPSFGDELLRQRIWNAQKIAGKKRTREGHLRRRCGSGHHV